MVDEVLAHRVVAAQEACDQHLGSNAIRARDEHRLFVSAKGVEGAERSDTGKDFAAMRAEDHKRASLYQVQIHQLERKLGAYGCVEAGA